MGRVKRRQIVMILGMVMVMDIALHFNLWDSDRRITSNDTELLRREYDLGNREAMDESAEWRRRYNLELEKSSNCYQELKYMKSLEDAAKVSTHQSKKIEMLQKENMDLFRSIESLKQRLEAEKVRCRVRHL